MGHKNYKWNISKNEGSNIVNKLIIDILCDCNNILEISELTFALQNRSKDIIIKNNNKKKNILNFIKNVLGGLTFFIKENDQFIIVNRGDRLFIQLNLINLNEWVLVDDY